MSKVTIKENLEDFPLYASILKKEEDGLSFKPVTPAINEPNHSMGVMDVYFAKKNISYKNTGEIAGKTTYVFPDNITLKDELAKKNVAIIIQESIANGLKSNNQYPNSTYIEQALTKNRYEKGETISFDIEKAEEIISYPKISKGYIGQEVYLVVKTCKLAGEEVTIGIKEKKPKILLASASDSLPIMIPETGKEESQITVFINENEIGIKKIALRPYQDTKNNPEEENLLSIEGWSKGLDDHEQHTLLSLDVIDTSKGVVNITKWLKDNAFILFDTAIIFIYPDGSLFKIGDLKNKRKIVYVYVGVDKVIYPICICDLLTVDKRKNGKQSNIQSGYINTVTYPKFANGRIKYRYPDDKIYENKIITSGPYNNSIRTLEYERAGKGIKTQIVEIPQNLNANINNGKVVTFKFIDTVRTYCGPLLFAGFIGALAEVGYRDIVSGGMCEKDGTCFPSITHVNGESVDTGYLYKDDRQQKFINAMFRFGFRDQIRGFAKWPFNHTRPAPFHNDHLHSGGFVPKWKKNNQQASAVV